MLTPIEISTLVDLPRAPQAPSRKMQDAIQSLFNRGLVAIDSGPVGSVLTLTPRGKVLVDMLCATPLPVERWVDPRDVQP